MHRYDQAAPGSNGCYSLATVGGWPYLAEGQRGGATENGVMCDTLRACGCLLLSLLHASLCSAYTLVKCDCNDALRLSGDMVI